MQTIPTIEDQSSGSTQSRWQRNRAILICISLGFTSGLPLYILINLLTAWLKTEQVDIKAIGLFALVGFPYTWKFVWSPFIDRFTLPFLGRRRGWMLVFQLSLFAVIVAMGQLSPQTDLIWIVWLCSALAFISASQDIVIDAYRREFLTDEQQAPGIAIFVNAYKFATLVPGSLSLILSDHFNWNMVFFFTGLFMLPGIITTLLIKEPRTYGEPPKNIREAIVLPFQEFLQRKGVTHALLILSFIFLYKLGDSMASALQTPFFMDLGFTRTEIGIVAKNSGLWASLAGGILGAYWLMKTGINRGLWIFGALQALAILGFAVLAKSGLSLWMLGLVMAADTFAIGLGTAAFTAYIATTTDPRYTATQFALFTSLAMVPRTFFNAVTGYIVAETGWFGFFIVCFILALPGMLLLPKIAPWNANNERKAL